MVRRREHDTGATCHHFCNLADTASGSVRCGGGHQPDLLAVVREPVLALVAHAHRVADMGTFGDGVFALPANYRCGNWRLVVDATSGFATDSHWYTFGCAGLGHAHGFALARLAGKPRSQVAQAVGYGNSPP